VLKNLEKGGANLVVKNEKCDHGFVTVRASYARFPQLLEKLETIKDVNRHLWVFSCVLLTEHFLTDFCSLRWLNEDKIYFITITQVVNKCGF
jgi:hypothetical protein